MLKNNIKVAFIIGNFPVVSESWLIEQIIGLIDDGIDVRIFSFKKGDNLQISEKVRKYKLLERTSYLSFPENKIKRIFFGLFIFFKLLFSRPSVLFKALNFFKYKKEALSLKYLFWSYPLVNNIEKCDVVHCHFGMIANKFLILKEILNLKQKIVVSFYGIDCSRYVRAKGQESYSKLIKEGSYFFPNNSKFKKDLISFGFPLEKVTVINNPIIISEYEYKQKKFNYGDVFKIIFVGRFVEKKGIEDLLKALARALDVYDKIELHVVGSGQDKNYNESIYNLARRLNIEKNVVFYGMKPHEEVLKLFSKMHTMMLLSKIAKDGDSEGLPYVLLEAQASGLPVFSTYHAGIPDGVVDGETGFLVKEGDYKTASEKILYLIKNPNTISVFGKNARRLIENKFGIENVNQKLIEIYSNLK